MEYTVMARRFRPQAFGEVVGQEAIAQALKNAIAADRVAHAYLFTGARGVGKTSTARILAKSLNCPEARNGDPCNQCEICRAVSEGSDVDVIEIDGASNRGIDEIRTLRANVNVRPMRCRYKIYIIDEVHMLTKEAFNALLKTLEEPPPNVKFIFCTTDPQKLPETILSRCQRFDFGTIETHRIRQRLVEIAQAEGVEVEPAAIELVARRAAGSMRDSQSLFDQLLAFGGPKVVAADVHRLLGTAPESRLLDLIRSLATRERAEVLTQLDHTLSAGVQVAEFTDQLIACCRDLMVLAAGASEATLLSVGDECRAELETLGRQWGLQSILAALQILADTRQRMKYVTYGRILVELALVRIASLAELDSLAETIALMKSGRLPAGPAAASGPPAGMSAAAPPRASSPPPEKKNDRGGGSPPPEPIPEDQPPTVTRVEFSPGNEQEFWAQVLTGLPDSPRKRFWAGSRPAISGPNQLVVSLPTWYSTFKQTLDRSPEQFRELEGVVHQTAGRPIQVVIELEAPPPEEAPAAARVGHREAERRPAAPDNDSYVQRALAAFGATVLRVDRLEAAPRPVEERSES